MYRLNRIPAKRTQGTDATPAPCAVPESRAFRISGLDAGPYFMDIEEVHTALPSGPLISCAQVRSTIFTTLSGIGT